MSDDEWIELAPLETDEDWRRLAEAYPDTFLAARWRLHLAWREAAPELYAAFGGERMFRPLAWVAKWIAKCERWFGAAKGSETDE